MREKIIVNKANGEKTEADLISFFEIVSTGKKYLFYTYNEMIDENLAKLYISEVTIQDGNFNLIGIMDDNDWNMVKEVMRNVLTGKENINIKYLKVGDI